ncbi:MAG: 1-acylglycerol-3-phosphate O-acyltransferase [Syntrophomonadaceae bacterium]|nr:1-acylglycerol-3-phosphate O-acyltransferase [Syntrophomonadaceae bacterium]
MLSWLRYFLIVIYLFLVGAVGILVCLARPFHPDNTRWFARIYSWGGAAILGIKIRRHNYDSLKDIGPCVYVVNHQHNFDLFICGRVVAKRTVTVGKKSLRWLPFFGQLYWLAGNVLIDRKNRKQSSATVNASTQALTSKNTSIWVFAEGTRNRGINLLPFKKGAFQMAIEAGVPVIPICVSSYVKNMDLRRLKSGVAEIRVLPPIMTDLLTSEDIANLMKQCWDTMKETIEAMDRSVYSCS